MRCPYMLKMLLLISASYSFKTSLGPCETENDLCGLGPIESEPKQQLVIVKITTVSCNLPCAVNSSKHCLYMTDTLFLVCAICGKYGV